MKNIAVIGLGYVGLPLAAAFGEKRPVVGFDINAKRIADLKQGVDFTREVSILTKFLPLQVRNGTSCPLNPAWLAGTVSVSTPTI